MSEITPPPSSPPSPSPSLPPRAPRSTWGLPHGLVTDFVVTDDVVAALIVTVLLLPQSLAYALLAGLPPVVGVMASLLPLLAYAAFGSSTTLAVGPVAVLAMMTVQAVLPVAQAQGVSAHLAAMVLALEMAAVFALAALLRLDVFAALLSAPVLHGFVTGACIVIALGQLPQLLGLAVQGHTLTELVHAAWAAGAAGTLRPHIATAVIGLSALLALWALRRYGAGAAAASGLSVRSAALVARLAPIFVVAAAIAWVAWAGTAANGATQGVALAGRVDLLQGLSFAPLWQAPWAVWWALAPAAGLLGLVAYVESLAVAEALAARRGEKVLPRRELLGLAAANAAASVSGGMPVTGGFARSIVNFDAGARTRMAGVWTAIFLALAVWGLGDALQFLPKAVLAATIIIAVLSLLDWRPFGQAWRWSRSEFVLMVGVAMLTVVVGVEEALAAGVVLSTGLLLQRTARPHWAEVGRLPGTQVFRNVKRYAVETIPGVLAIRIDESLLFTNSRWLSDTLGAMSSQPHAFRAELQAQTQQSEARQSQTQQSQARQSQTAHLRHLVLVMSGVNDIDFTGLEGLMHLARDLKAQGVQLHLSEVKGPVLDRLQALGLQAWLSGRVFRTQNDAHEALAPCDLPATPQAPGA